MSDYEKESEQESCEEDQAAPGRSDEEGGKGYGGPDRRDRSERRQTGPERRSGWDRRRGPGRRRSDDRKSAEEGEMDDEQFAFIMAIDEYKRVNKRPFPSFTEVLEIAKALGYRKVADPTPISDLAKE